MKRDFSLGDRVRLSALGAVRCPRLAGKVGLKTAFVPRPLERGPGRTPDPTPDPSFTVVANDFMDLAAKLNV